MSASERSEQEEPLARAAKHAVSASERSEQEKPLARAAKAAVSASEGSEKKALSSGGQARSERQRTQRKKSP